MNQSTAQPAGAGSPGARFPVVRPRRLRRTPGLRRMVKESRLDVAQFIYPIFVSHGAGIQREVSSMPGIFQWSIDRLDREIEEVASLRIPAVLLFGLPESKDETGSEAYNDGGIVQRAIRRIKDLAPDLLVVTDVCLCEYTSHGHCGVVRNGEIDNDATLELLSLSAVSHAAAGADIVAPSDMMDGRVWAIRQALDRHGYDQTSIMAYSAKYASAFYGPFREAAECAPQFGDRRAYQMDPSNRREAVREALLDVAEGADILMV
ncbi:MAG: porphobilinogen synthase, partial [Dehalococcoidia bacterium]|nr:porphobilinogen synthase [Dehalococcoidia bacterium]